MDVKEIIDTISTHYEIIVIIDGSDDATLAHAESCPSTQVRVFGYALNRDKGHAVRFGFHQASGKFVGFIDAVATSTQLGS